MANYSKMASEIIACVGGKENIRDLFHCATRLRFSLVDESKADQEKIKKIDGSKRFVENQPGRERRGRGNSDKHLVAEV